MSAAPRSDEAEPVLSLAEYAVLGVVGEGRQHGFAVARLLGGDGDIGRVYTVARPAVYRAVERLIEAGLLDTLEVEPGERGPRRTPLELTGEGRRALESWLWVPVRHVRDIRTEFLVKVVLISRAGGDPTRLIRSQVQVVAPVVAGLVEQHRQAVGAERVVAAWRLRSAQAAQQFLEELAAEASAGALITRTE